MFFYIPKHPLFDIESPHKGDTFYFAEKEGTFHRSRDMVTKKATYLGHKRGALLKIWDDPVTDTEATGMTVHDVGEMALFTQAECLQIIEDVGENAIRKALIDKSNFDKAIVDDEYKYFIDSALTTATMARFQFLTSIPFNTY